MTRKLADWFLSSRGGQIFILFHHQGRNISSISSTNLQAHIILVIIMIKKENVIVDTGWVSFTITHAKDSKLHILWRPLFHKFNLIIIILSMHRSYLLWAQRILDCSEDDFEYKGILCSELSVDCVLDCPDIVSNDVEEGNIRAICRCNITHHHQHLHMIKS